MTTAGWRRFPVHREPPEDRSPPQRPTGLTRQLPLTQNRFSIQLILDLYE
jgi:hypothetical protein